ncbi:hypothetical protein EV360DRAFT_72446 [Lentinula raphanica]|nr:hypothetical protein EV360DRAFT_72446 [Lentinula raphanica]
MYKNYYYLSSDEEKKLQDWLAAPDSSITYTSAVNKKVAGTGQWILEDPVYLKWKEEGSILCIQGQAGSGKTFLLTNIIQSFKQATFPTSMIYHYFDTRDNSGLKSSFQGLLSSFLLQLGSQDQKIHPALQHLHESLKQGLVHSRPTNTELEDTLVKITKDLAEKKYQVYVIIDALDECKEEKDVWDFCVKIISLELEKISFESTVLNTEIQTTLMEKADGGFRYIDCQLQILKDSASARRIRKALNKLPSNLEETYSEAIERCEKSDYSDEAQYILSWVLYAFEPLHMRQVATILSIDLQSKEVELDAKMLVGLEKIIDTTLVTVDNRDIVQLPHASVKDFLQDSHNNSQTRRLLNINAQLAHNIIGQIQREYKPIWGDIDWLRRQDIVTFEQYATEYWAKHSQYNERGESPCEDLSELSQAFLSSNLQIFDNWKQNLWEFNGSGSVFVFVQCSNLQVAAFFGMKICMFKKWDTMAMQFKQQQLKHGAEVNLQGGHFGTAITAAAFWGYQDVVEYLVQHGANINLQGGHFGTAITAAAYRGHQDIVEYLVQHGADINLQDINLQSGDVGAALAAAASRGHQGIVEYFVQHSADINLQSGYYGTAIAAAASEVQISIWRVVILKLQLLQQHLEVTKMLLNIFSNMAQISIYRVVIEIKGWWGYPFVVA